MALITPNVGVGNASLASPLITPGYPMAAVPKSSPLSDSENPAVQLPAGASVRRDASLAQVGDQSNRVI